MKKTLTGLIALLFIGAGAANAQSEKQIKPPPPPPPPPKVELTKYVPPIIESKEFIRRNPSVANIEWSTEKIIVRLKDGKTENYDLRNETEKKAFIDKYGLPPTTPLPPPPPPAPPKPPKTS